VKVAISQLERIALALTEITCANCAPTIYVIALQSRDW
jgi:hypothetical protein